jgi:hypothetical protein
MKNPMRQFRRCDGVEVRIGMAPIMKEQFNLLCPASLQKQT